MSGDRKYRNSVVITGATGAIGLALAKMVVRECSSLILGCRNLKRGAAIKCELESLCEHCRVEVVELDLFSIGSIEQFAQVLTGRKLDALINVAGVLASRFELSATGLEKNCAVNFVGTTTLCRLLKENLVSGGRIVNVISCTVWLAKIDTNYLRSSQQTQRRLYFRLVDYAKSKRALLLSSQLMAKQFPELIVTVADPGIVDSAMIRMERWYDPLADILFRPFIKSSQQGALPLYRALTTSPLQPGNLHLFRGRHHHKLLPFPHPQQTLASTICQSILSLANNTK